MKAAIRTRALMVLLLVGLAGCGSEIEDRLAALEQQAVDEAQREERLRSRIAAALDAMAQRVDAVVDEVARSSGIAVPEAPPVEELASFAEPTARPGIAGSRTPSAIEAAVAARHRLWWWFVVGAAVITAGGLVWRLRRTSSTRTEGSADAWSAASVLTEGLHGQKQVIAGVRDGEAREPLLSELVFDDEVFVLDPADEGLSLEGGARAVDSGSPEESPTPGATVSPLVGPSTQKPMRGPDPVRGSGERSQEPAIEIPREPPRWSFQLEAHDPVLARAAIAAYLRHDPRVLQRPAPVVRDHPSGLAVECALLPGLVAGEREHLRATLQRLVAAR